MGGTPRATTAWLDIGIDAAGRSPRVTMEAIFLYPRYLLVGPYSNGPLIGAAFILWMALRAYIMATAADAGCALLLDRLDATPSLHRLMRLLRGLLVTLWAISVLMLMFWAYFLISMALGVSVPGTVTMVVAFAAAGAAYIIQNMEAGLRAVGAGQRSVTLALGMSSPQALLAMVLSQAWRTTLPSLANQWVPVVKDTLPTYTVGVMELFTIVSQVNSRMVVYPAEVSGTMAMLYFLLCTGIEALPN